MDSSRGNQKRPVFCRRSIGLSSIFVRVTAYGICRLLSVGWVLGFSPTSDASRKSKFLHMIQTLRFLEGLRSTQSIYSKMEQRGLEAPLSEGVYTFMGLYDILWVKSIEESSTHDALASNFMVSVVHGV